MPLQIMQNIYLASLTGIVRSAQCLLNIMFFILFCFCLLFLLWLSFLFVIVVIVGVAFLIVIN